MLLFSNGGLGDETSLYEEDLEFELLNEELSYDDGDDDDEEEEGGDSSNCDENIFEESLINPS